MILSVASSGFAYDGLIEGKVTVVEASYVPNYVTFQMSTGTDACPAQSWLRWDGSFHGVNPASNVKAVYGQLLSAMLTQKTAKLFFYNVAPDGHPCEGEYIHFLSE